MLLLNVLYSNTATPWSADCPVTLTTQPVGFLSNGLSTPNQVPMFVHQVGDAKPRTLHAATFAVVSCDCSARYRQAERKDNGENEAKDFSLHKCLLATQTHFRAAETVVRLPGSGLNRQMSALNGRHFTPISKDR